MLLSRNLGADVRLVDDGFDIGVRKSWEDALKDVEAHCGKPCYRVRNAINAMKAAKNAARPPGGANDQRGASPLGPVGVD